MRVVTRVEGVWLGHVSAALSHVGTPLTSPAPRYSPRRDAVMGYADVAYGNHRWPLPRQLIVHPGK